MTVDMMLIGFISELFLMREKKPFQINIPSIFRMLTTNF